MPRILLTNDDGINAPGLRALEASIAELGEVYVVAPLHEQSGTSRAITLRQPLRYSEAGDNRFSVEGTPTDAMMMALSVILDFEPDLVIVGINGGPNLGENIFYSGTVAGAAEAAKHGIASFAISVAERTNIDFAPSAKFAVRLARRVLEDGLEKGVALNVNVPHPNHLGVEITRQSPRISRNVMQSGKDPRGRPYYWVHEEISLDAAEEGTDYSAVRNGKISVTPIRFDHTADGFAERLAGWRDLK